MTEKGDPVVTATKPVELLHMVTFGNDVHLFSHDALKSAKILYTVAVGANFDTTMYTIDTDQWATIQASLNELVTIDVHDHRE